MGRREYWSTPSTVYVNFPSFILRCCHPDAQTWRDDLKLDLTEFYRRTKTEPELARLMTIALDQWFEIDAQDIQVDPMQFSDTLRNLIIEQNVIGGWRQVFSGRFSKEWSVVQQTQYNRLPRQEGQHKRTGNQWLFQLIVVLRKWWDKRWIARNKAEHGYCTTLYRASISNSIQYTLLLVSNTTLVHWPCTVLGYTGRLVIQ